MKHPQIIHRQILRMRAERRAGELLREMEKNKGARGNPHGRGAKIVRSQETTAHPKLSDLGVSKTQSQLFGEEARKETGEAHRIAATLPRQSRDRLGTGVSLTYRQNEDARYENIEPMAKACER